MGIKVVTDSTANLSPQEVTALGVTVIPSYIFFGTEEYKENISLTYPEFIEKLRQTKVHPQTAPPTAAEFVKCYESVLQESPSLVSLHLTSKLSNIYRNATIARDMILRSRPEAKICVIDSQLVDIPLGLLVKEAVKLARLGKELQEIEVSIQNMIAKMGGYIYVDSLEFLKRGGRVSSLAAFLGGLLNLKPILKLEQGELKASEKVSGKEKALEAMVALLKKDIPEGSRVVLGVGDALAREEGDKLLALLRSQFHCVETFRVNICQSVTIHAGPGSLAVFYRIL